MRKELTILMSIVMMTGFSVAVEGHDGPDNKPSITGQQPDNPGPDGEKGDSPDSLGPDQKMDGNNTGLSMAMSNAGDAVSKNVLEPISNGVKGIGAMFSFQNIFGNADNSSAENLTENESQNETEGGFLGFIFGNAPENVTEEAQP